MATMFGRDEGAPLSGEASGDAVWAFAPDRPPSSDAAAVAIVAPTTARRVAIRSDDDEVAHAPIGPAWVEISGFTLSPF